MAKFCRSCGKPVEEGAAKCANCGAALNAPAAPAKKTPEALDKVSDVINTIFMVVEKVLRIVAAKTVTAVKNAQANQAAKAGTPGAPARDTNLNVVRLAIVAVLIVLALIAGIMNLTMKYEVNAKLTVSYDGEKTTQTQSGPIGDLAESDEFIGFILVNLLWAVFNLVLIVLAVLVLLKVLKLVNTDGKFKGFALTGLIGDALYMILYWICGTVSDKVMGMTATISVGLHWFVWLHVIAFALAFGLTFVNLQPAAIEAPQTPAE